MEITLEAIISFVGLFLGSGGGIFLWKYTRQRASAEAKKAEAEAFQERIEANKEMQSLYQTLIEDVKKDREDRQAIVDEQRQYISEIKQDRDELRLERNKMQKRLTQLSEELDDVKRAQARQGRQLEAMRPFLCADMKCKKRVLVAAWEAGIGNENDNENEG